jgi:hypothetical protein
VAIGAVKVLFVKVTVFDAVTDGAAHSSPLVALEFAVRTCPLLPTDKTDSVSFAEAESKSPLAAKSVAFNDEPISIADI